MAMMDGRYITEARTAAVSAVSTRYLARPDASTLAIIGSGVQARSHLEAYQHVRQLKDVRVWSPQPRSRERFVDDMSRPRPMPIVAADTAEAAVRGADLIVLATSSPTPVIDDAWVSDGRARRVASAPAARISGRCRRRSSRAAGCSSTRAPPPSSNPATSSMNIADGLFDASHIRGELGEVVLGRVAGRTIADRHHRSSSRSAWPWRTSSPPIWCFAAPRNPAPARS